MKKLIKSIVYLSLIGTTTGKLPISPLINLVGLFVLLKKRITINKYVFPFFLLIVYCLLSVLLISPESLLKYDFYRHDGNIFPSYLPLIFLSILSIRFNLYKILKYYLIISVVILSFSILIFSFSTFKAHNALGGFLAELLCISFVFSYFSKKNLKLFYLFITILIMYLLIKSDSRGSILAVIFTIIFVFYLSKYRKFIFSLFLIIIFSFEFFIAYPEWISLGKPPNFFQNKEISLNIEGVRWWTIVDRVFYLWPRALDAWINSPIIGIGFSKYNDWPYQLEGVPLFKINLSHNIYNDAHAHNSYLHFLAETGIVGLFLLIISIFSLDAFIRKKINNELYKKVLLLLLWYLVFASFTEHRFTTPSQAILFSILCGISIANYNFRKKLNQNKEGIIYVNKGY